MRGRQLDQKSKADASETAVDGRLDRERLDLALEAVSDGVWDYNLITGEVWINQQYLDMLGYRRDEFPTTLEGWFGSLHPEDRAKIEAEIESVANGEMTAVGGEFRLRAKDGGWRWIMSRGKVVAHTEDGRPARMVGTNVDITARKEAEESLAISQAWAQALIDAIPDMLLRLDGQGVVRGFHPPKSMTHGFVAEDILHRHIREVLPQRAVGEILACQAEVLAGQGPRMLFYELGEGDRRRYFEGRMVPHGNDETLLMVRDITQRHRAEQALRDSEERHRLVVENAAEGILVLQDGQAKFYNQKAMDIAGFDKGPPLGSNALQMIHPDDLPRVAEIHMRRLAGEEVPDSYQFRIFDKAGQVRWLHINVVTIQWNDKPASLNFISDVTELKNTEQELRRSRQFLDQTINALDDPVFVKDAQHRWVVLNDASCRLMGRLREELLGKTDYDLFPPEQADVFWAADDHVLETGETLVNEEEITWHGRLHHISTKKSRWIDPVSGDKFIAGTIRDITERVNHEQELAEGQARYRHLLERLPDPVVIYDLEGRVQLVNSAFERVYGWTYAELEGGKINFVPPESKPETLTAIARMLRGENVEPFFTRRYTKDGRVLEVELSSAPYHDQKGEQVGNIVILRNVTELRQAERALRQSERTANDLLNASTQAVLLFDLDDRILATNKVAAQRFGRTPEEMRGVDANGLLDEETARARRVNRDQVLKNGKTLRVVDTRDGMVFDNNYAPLFDVKGRIDRIAVFSSDITEQVRAEQQARQQEQQLFQAAKMASLGTLVSGVAHEINNPNTFIMVNAPVLERIWQAVAPVLEKHCRAGGKLEAGGLSCEETLAMAPNLISGIMEGARRVANIVANLQDHARLEQADESGPVDLNEVVEGAMRIISMAVKKYTERLSVVAAGDLPLVQGNRQRLEQVVINLVVNACQALPGRECAVLVSTSHDPEARRVVLRVEDEGEGMDPDRIKQATDPFFTTKRGQGGTGLGLSIVSSIVTEHDGQMEFESTPGAGTTVTVSLPEFQG